MENPNGYVGVTSNEWYQYLFGNGIVDEVNFWRKQTNSFNSLVTGEPFFFLVKNEKGVQGERRVLGYGSFQRYEVLDIETAWNKYGVRNGDENRESFCKRMRSMFGIENTQNRIGCIILSDLEFFVRPVLLSRIGIDFRNSVVSGKCITSEEVKTILMEASNTTSYLRSIPLLQPKEAGESFEKVHKSIHSHISKVQGSQYKIVLETVLKDIESDEIENDRLNQRYEGSVNVYYGKRYERDPENRRRAIELHGVCCKACGFDFEKVYGERGKDFIEVHHIKPLSLLGGEKTLVDPLTDLVPVCSNCHRMIHRRHDDVLTIEQLKQILNG